MLHFPIRGLCFIDDVIIFSKNYEDHIEHLAEVLRRFKEANIKLKASKCAFAKAEVKYLGHIMVKDGIETDPDKLKVMTNFPVPKNIYFPFGFEGRIWDLIVSVPDYCLSFYSTLFAYRNFY